MGAHTLRAVTVTIFFSRPCESKEGKWLLSFVLCVQHNEPLCGCTICTATFGSRHVCGVSCYNDSTSKF